MWWDLSPLGTTVTVWPIVPAPDVDDDDDYDDDYNCGAISRMRIGRGNRSTRRKPAPVPLCPPQIPNGLTRARTRSASVGSRRLTAWAMARTISVTLYSQSVLKMTLRWEDDIKVNLEKWGSDDLKWIQLSLDGITIAVTLVMFEYRSGHRPPWLRLVVLFLTPTKQMPVYVTSIGLRRLPSKIHIIHSTSPNCFIK
jgi:hypothetical protein